MNSAGLRLLRLIPYRRECDVRYLDKSGRPRNQSHLKHARKKGLPWDIPFQAEVPGSCLIPFIGCVHKRRRKKARRVYGADITEEFFSDVPALEQAAERRTAADISLYASYNRFDQSKFVYFVQAEDDPRSPIKIGFSIDPENRCDEIQYRRELAGCTSLPPLHVLAKIPGGREIERYLHRAFREFDMSGEWFFPAPELLALINEINEYRPIKVTA